MSVVYIHDADPGALRERLAALRDDLTEARLTGWKLRGTASRNALLAHIAQDADDARGSVALIDLRAETGDIEQVGFRVVETIRRHPSLAAVCRPIVCTDEMTAANARFADTVGAFAILDTTWASGAPGTPVLDLILWAIQEKAGQLRLHRQPVRVIPEEGADDVGEQHERQARFRSWFGFSPNELHFSLLWGMANAVELEFLRAYLAEAGLATSPRAARRQLERLQQSMVSSVEAMDRPETARAEMARRFLAEAIPPQPDPLARLNWPLLTHVRDLWHAERDVIRLAFLDPDAQKTIETFFELLTLPKVGAEERHEAIQEAIRATAARLDQPIARVGEATYRAVHAIDDAWEDNRMHQVDEAVTQIDL